MPLRHVLITGATRGIGEAMARHYLASGDCVIGVGRTPSTLAHQRYTHHCLDVSDGGAVDALFRTLRVTVPVLDVLINNAGIASMNSVALTPTETARRILETNCLGTFNFTRAAVRLMRRAPHGRIVNVSTVAVPMRLEGEAMYAASKSAVEMFTRITAREFAAFGITCNAVGPCPIQTNLTASVPTSKIDAVLAGQAIHEWAKPEDVVNVVEFFLRPESRMITGQVVYLGGVS